jgi:VIT1/CCC1 family predicted Fe2+/Mn2+ transporter
MVENRQTPISNEVRRRLLDYQRNELTEHHIYRKLARTIPSAENRRILEDIAKEELQHYELWRAYTQQEVSPNRWSIWKYYVISRVLGFTFGVKLMEAAEKRIQVDYAQLRGTIPDAEAIARDEEQHEKALLQLLDEERLRYTGSMVLGLNDALVELTGALAGLTLALQNARLIALTGSITGVAAALSMAAAEYLAVKSEKTVKKPLKAATYTGIAYIITVVLLILPYLVLSNYYVSLACTLAVAVLIIAFFNYYIAVARSEPFTGRFLEMAGLSLGVAAISFLVGFALRAVMGVDV